MNCVFSPPGLVANARGMQTFTFRADRALSSIRTVEAPPWAQGRPAGLGRLARCPDWPRGGRPGAAQGPEHGRTAPVAHPRWTRLAEVMLHDRETLSHAEKRNGSDQWVVRAGSAELGEARAACSAQVHHSLAEVVADRGATSR